MEAVLETCTDTEHTLRGQNPQSMVELPLLLLTTPPRHRGHPTLTSYPLSLSLRGAPEARKESYSGR